GKLKHAFAVGFDVQTNEALVGVGSNYLEYRLALESPRRWISRVASLVEAHPDQRSGGRRRVLLDKNFLCPAFVIDRIEPPELRPLDLRKKERTLLAADQIREKTLVEKSATPLEFRLPSKECFDVSRIDRLWRATSVFLQDVLPRSVSKPKDRGFEVF